MTAQVVRYLAGDGKVEVGFEIDPPSGFRPVSAGERITSRVRDAVQPAIEAAQDVLGELKELQPDEVEVRFGIKVSGSAAWLVAKSGGEASFEVTLHWRRAEEPPTGAATASEFAEVGHETPVPSEPPEVASGAGPEQAAA